MRESGRCEHRREKSKRQMHIDSSQVEAALNPVRGVRDALRRRGIQPRDYAKQNRQSVRHASQLNAQRKEQRAYASQLGAPPKRRISTALNRDICEEDAKNNYILRNIIEAGARSRSSLQTEQNPSETQSWTQKQDYGKVPSYLQMRKVEMAEEREARERAKEVSLCPPGMRILDATEQKEALESIVQNKSTVETELQNLPLMIETPSLMKLKTELERRLVELEEAERIFSRPKVIVKS